MTPKKDRREYHVGVNYGDTNALKVPLLRPLSEADFWQQLGKYEPVLEAVYVSNDGVEYYEPPPYDLIELTSSKSYNVDS